MRIDTKVSRPNNSRRTRRNSIFRCANLPQPNYSESHYIDDIVQCTAAAASGTGWAMRMQECLWNAAPADRIASMQSQNSHMYCGWYCWWDVYSFDANCFSFPLRLPRDPRFCARFAILGSCYLSASSYVFCVQYCRLMAARNDITSVRMCAADLRIRWYPLQKHEWNTKSMVKSR